MKSALARNTFWMLGGSSSRVILQAFYFLLISRSLGAAEYGAFVGAVSLVSVVAPFSSLGTGFILIKKVARDRATFSRYWGASLSFTFLSGCILSCLVLVTARAVWGHSVPLRVLLLVGISDIIILRVVDIANQAFVAVEVLRKSALLDVVLSAVRTLAALWLRFAVHSPTAVSWASLYLLSTGAAAIYAFVAVARNVGLPRLGMHFSLPELREGFYFAVSQSAQTIYNDIDKTMLVRFGGLEATGIYGAAYRIADASFTPVSALVSATLAKFFRHGKEGIAASTRFAKRLLPYTAGYGFLAFLFLFAASPTLPILLGRDFTRAGIALQWLSPLVFLKAIHYFLANSLSGAGYQGLRASIQLGIVGLNVALNLWLIPTYSWRGAAWASLASDGALVLGLFVAIVGLNRKRSLSQAAFEADPRVVL
jgi:O-antigen/teichoic acid export membrane protein